jgi:hypothetical protein
VEALDLRSFFRSRRTSASSRRLLSNLLLIAMFAFVLARSIDGQVVAARQANLPLAAEEATEVPIPTQSAHDLPRLRGQYR